MNGTNEGGIDDAAGPAPLAGIRVIDLSQNLAGPLATQVLGDLGADVVKVEPPGGDAARAWGPPFWGGESPLFLCANRNKRSIVLDLDDDDARDTLRRLVAGADIFVQAFRAGVIERLGFGPDRLRGDHPSLIYVSVTAYGAGGPLAGLPGYDPLMQAFAGLMSVTGHPGAPPARVGTSVVDMGTGMWTAIAVMAAIRERDRTGRGSHVVTSLLESALASMAYHLQGHLATGTVPGPMGSGLGMIAPYQAFPAADGQVMIAAGNDALFRRLCHALEIEDLASDPRFETNADRVGGRQTLADAIAVRTRTFDVADLLARLQAAGVPCAPIQDVAEVARNEQVRATGVLRPAPSSEIEGYVDIALPASWDGRRAPARRGPPAVGEHTRDVLRELGPG